MPTLCGCCCYCRHRIAEIRRSWWINCNDSSSKRRGCQRRQNHATFVEEVCPDTAAICSRGGWMGGRTTGKATGCLITREQTIDYSHQSTVEENAAPDTSTTTARVVATLIRAS